MYGADEQSYDDSRSNALSTSRQDNREKLPSVTRPAIVATNVSSENRQRSILPVNSRNLSMTGDDIDAAFDAMQVNGQIRSMANMSTVDNGQRALSTIAESLDTNENKFNSKSIESTTDDELDLDVYLSKSKPTIDQRTSKISSSSIRNEPNVAVPMAQYTQLSVNRSADIRTPSASFSLHVDSNAFVHGNAQHTDSSADDIDDDVEQLLGNLEVSISIQPGRMHSCAHT
jgi:hypothetical protein